MPLEIGGGQVDPKSTGKRKKRRKPVAPVVGERGSKVPVDRSVPPGVSQVEANRTPYRGSSNPAFARVGFSGDIFSFNERVTAAHQAYASNFGYDPSPGLLLDLVRAPVRTEEYTDLLKMPTSFQRARAIAALEADRQDAINNPKREGGPYQGAIRVEEYEGQRSEDIAAGEPDILAAQIGPDMAGTVSAFEKYAFGVPVLAAHQMLEAAVSAPAGMVAVGSASYKDWDDLLSGGDASFKRSREIAAAIGSSVAEDFRHPLENPGYLFLDVLGVASVGAGSAARVGAAGRAGRAAGIAKRGDVPLDIENLRPQTLTQIGRGNVARAVISGLARRPLPGTIALGPKGVQERVLASENAARRGVQRIVYGFYNRQIQKHLDAPATGMIGKQGRVKQFRQSVFSPEKTLGRTAAARVRTERDFLLAPVHELARAHRATVNLGAIYRRLPLLSRTTRGKAQRVEGANAFGLSIGEQMAILFRATDSIDPVGTWRGFHERMIEWGYGDADAHRAKLAAIELGAQQYANPSKRLQRAMRVAEEVSREQQLMKIELLGLNRVNAENRISSSAEVLRAAQAYEKRAEPKTRDVIEETPFSEKLTPKQLETKKAALAGYRDELRATNPTDKHRIGQIERNIERLEREIQTGVSTGVRKTKKSVAESAPLVSGSVSKSDFIRRVDEIIGGPSLTRMLEGSFYYPEVRRADAPIFPGDASIGFARAGGKYGTPTPNPDRYLPELSHRYEAKAIRAGDTVVDASYLIGGAYARVARVVSVMEDHKRLLALSVEVPNAALKQQRGFLRPIRTLEGVPDELKAKIAPFFEDRVLTAKESVELADKGLLEALHGYLYPEGKVGDSIEGVRWVDERFVTDLHRFPGEPSDAMKVFVGLNEPVKVAAIYGRPAYSLNILSNAGMLLFQQGPMAPVSLYKSLTARKKYGDRAVAAMDAAVGEGKARSYTPDDLAVAKASRSFAHIWSTLVDGWMRRAAFIYEMEKRGFDTPEKVNALLDPKKRENVDTRVEIARRGNKALVEFNNLGWFEKQHLRHIIFVYPWVSRSSVWAVRTMLEHPVKTWFGSELGQIGEQYVSETLGDAMGYAKALLPDWFDNTGYVPVGTDDQGNPFIINTAPINTFSTLSELYQTGSGVFTDDPLTSLEEMLGPGAELVLRAVTGRNQWGQKYEHGAAGGVAEVLGGLPQWSAVRRARDIDPSVDAKGKRQQASITKPDEAAFQLPTSKGQVARPEDRPIFIPGLENVYGPLISGGLWPRAADVEAIQERYWRQQPKEDQKAQKAKTRAQLLRERIRDEVRMIREAETITSKVLGQPVPKAVNEAMKLTEAFQYAITDFSIKRGRGPTPAETRALQIDRLESMGRLNPDRAKELRNQLKQAIKRDDLGSFTRDFGDNHLNRQAMLQWHGERNAVLDVANNIGAQADYLRKTGLFTGTIPGADNLLTRKKLSPSAKQLGKTGGVDYTLDSPAYAVGRAYLDYEQRLKARTPADASFLEGVEGAAHKAWLDDMDKPISIDGKKYPSPVRLKWASKVLSETLDNPDYETETLTALSVQSWETLTDFEKEIVGRKPADNVSKGWMIFEAAAGGFRGNLIASDAPNVSIYDRVNKKQETLSDVIPEALSSREVSREHKTILAKWVDKHYVPGFYKDFLYSMESKAHRVARLPVITESAHKQDWNEITGWAEEYVRAIRDLRANEETGIEALQNEWKDYATRSLHPWLMSSREVPSSMRVELERLGGVDFLRSLIEGA